MARSALVVADRRAARVSARPAFGTPCFRPALRSSDRAHLRAAGDAPGIGPRRVGLLLAGSPYGAVTVQDPATKPRAAFTSKSSAKPYLSAAFAFKAKS